MEAAREGRGDNSADLLASKFSPLTYYKRRCKGMRYRAQEPELKKARNDYSDPFSVPNLSEELNSGKFRSVTSRDLDVEKKPIKEKLQVRQPETPLVPQDVIDLEDDGAADHVVAERLEVVVIASDDEDIGDQRHFNADCEPAAELLMNEFWAHENGEYKDRGSAELQSLRNHDARLAGENETKNAKGAYHGMEDNLQSEEGNGMRYRDQEPGLKKARNDYSDPFSDPNLLEELNSGKFGSVTEDIKDLLARKSQAINSYFLMHSRDLDVKKKPIQEELQVRQPETPLVRQDVIDLEDDGVADHVVAERLEVVVIVSDDEDIGDRRHFNADRKPAAEFLMNEFWDRGPAELQSLRNQDERLAAENETKHTKDVYHGMEDNLKSEEVNVHENGEYKDRGPAELQSLRNHDAGLAGENETKNAKGVYHGMEDNLQSEDGNATEGYHNHIQDRGLAELQSLRNHDAEHAGENETKNAKGLYHGMEYNRQSEEGTDRGLAELQSLRNQDARLAGENETKNAKGVYHGMEDNLQSEEGNARDWVQNQSLSNDDPRLAGENATRKDKGVYVGVEDDVQSEEGNCQTDSDYDGLADIWKEMNVAFECCKDTAEDPLPDKLVTVGLDECDHTFVLKDDLGYVCRICGVIQRGIETIIEYQYAKGKRTTRTYSYEAWATKDKEPSEILDGVKLSGQDFIVSEISVHPRHRKQMKPHQVAGFNFLLSNLVAENPGGCIMAHAPGSGKTFMIISFIQSFLGKYPDARPLVVLPRGILAIWKKEFQRWQVEEIPLYDFYSVRADNRSQQLEVLKQWEDQKSILFLGYKQFSSIVCDCETNKTSAACQELLLTCPSILILDEGHTPRNEDTDVLNSLKKVRTPRKVVLSGTLYQNHVKEVFNIFDLVRPRFMRLDTSRAIIRRILGRVSSSRKNVKTKGLENVFYESVECTLQKDEDFNRKITVIQDLREMTSKVLHFYKGDFLDELPGLVDFTVLLNLTPRQKREVEGLIKIAKKFKISSDGSALYVHPRLRYLLKNSSTKERDRPNDTEMDDILENLDVREGVKAKFFLNLLGLCESGGEKLLVFSQYLQPLKFLERLAVRVKGWSLGKEIFVITGDSSSENREWSMDCFNTSADARVFFGSIKACGEGISLVGASRVIILDVHLNPSVTRQAIGRAFRPGQEKKVYTYRLVAADSPEEEDHSTCFKKESISKMWFEWNEYCGHKEFEMQTLNVTDCGDLFLESPKLGEDVKALYKR